MNFTIPKFKTYRVEDYKAATRMMDSLWNRFCHNQGATSLPYWMDMFSKEKSANKMIKALAKRGMIRTTIKHNWAEIELNPTYVESMYEKSEITRLILGTKIAKYIPQLADKDAKNPQFDQTKLKSGVKQTGLARFGFAEAGQKHSFKYDTEMMLKYKPEIVRYSVKSMKKMEAKLNKSLRVPEGYDYESIIENVIDIIIDEKDEEYILGKLTNDSRGRAIYECLRTIFNPLANKMARALVIAPEESPDEEGIESAYLCIAELTTGFEGDISKKLELGKLAYKDRTYHKLDTSTEKGIDDLFENIWLERLYNDMEKLEADPKHKVTTPLEVDFSSSNMVMIGLLLGHNKYVDHTKYMWSIEGLTKQHVKFAQTPYVFGSGASIKALWDKKRLEYNSAQVALMKKEQKSGKFAIANMLKDIITKDSRPTPEMDICIQREEFIVECNKTKNVGDTAKQYVVYNTETSRFSVIHHTNTHTVPDLERFKIYFMTLLIHNLDSQILDNIVMKMDWILPIHDAGIVTWNGAGEMRRYAVVEMQYVLDNNRSTMVNYLKSINLTKTGWVKYAKLLELVEKENEDQEDIELSPFLLK